MTILLVVDNPKRWPLHIAGVEVVAARSYLTDPAYSEGRGIKVFNLCRFYRYQTAGYYVSLLAAARGHKPMPDINTIQDLKSPSVIRVLSEDLDDQIQRSLRPLQSDGFTLSIYFGRNTARRYRSLALNLFNLFRARPVPPRRQKRQVGAGVGSSHFRQRDTGEPPRLRHRGRGRLFRRSLARRLPLRPGCAGQSRGTGPAVQ